VSALLALLTLLTWLVARVLLLLAWLLAAALLLARLLARVLALLTGALVRIVLVAHVGISFVEHRANRLHHRLVSMEHPVPP